MWYKSPLFKMFIRDSIAIVVGLAFLRIARPVLAISPEIQSIFDLLYIDIVSASSARYVNYINSGLEFLSFYSLPFMLAGFLSGFLGARKGGVLLGIIPSAFYTLTFVFLVPIIHVANQAPAGANNWSVWAVLYPSVYLLSGVIGGVMGWRLRFMIESMRTKLRTTI